MGASRHSIGWRIFFGVVLLLALAWLVANRSEGEQFVRMVQNARPRWLVVGLLLQAATYPVDGAVWARVLARRRTPERIGAATATRLAFAKFFVDQFLPGGGVGGTVLTIRSLHTRGISRKEAMVALVARMVSYYFAYSIALALAVAIGWWARAAVPRVVLAIGSALAFAFLFVPSLLLWFLRHRERRLPQFLLRTRLLSKAQPVIDPMTRAAPAVVADRVMLLECTALQLAIFLLDGATLWAMLQGVGTDVALPIAHAAFLIGFVAGSVGVPAGIGVFEAGTVAGLAIFGVPGAPALAATLLFRGLSLWLPLAPGAYFARKESWR